MKLEDRTKRDVEIMRAIKAGKPPLDLAIKHRLTVNRVNQIVEREKWKRPTRKIGTPKVHRPRGR